MSKYKNLIISKTSLDKDLSKSKFFRSKFSTEKNISFLNKYELVVNCDPFNFITKRYFNKKISIEIVDNNDHIRFILVDNGIGFGQIKDDIKKIINPYFTTKKNGTGLGLSIVNKIINDHNGEINFEPQKDGAKIIIKFSRNAN